MKGVYVALLCAGLVALAGCGPRIDNPADVAAVRTLVEDFGKALNAGDADAAVATMTDRTVYADNHFPVAVGRDAARGVIGGGFGLFTFDFKAPVEEVRVTGDAAVARGTWSVKLTPKVEGMAPVDDGGTWAAGCSRQADGSWKFDWVVPNSNQPVPGATATGADEMALLKLEQEWGAAAARKDAAAIETFLADEFVSNFEGKALGKRAFLAQVKANPATIESFSLSDMRTFVFGTMALVDGVVTEKATTAGKDSGMRMRFTEVYAKRDGRWLCVTQYVAPAP